jgi:hypothetical protein
MPTIASVAPSADARLATFEAEPAERRIPHLKELLERFGPLKQRERPALLVGRALDCRDFECALEERALGELLDVAELNPDSAAVGRPQPVEQLGERKARGAEDPTELERPLEVEHREPVGDRIEVGRQLRRTFAKRVDPCGEVATRAVRVDERHHPSIDHAGTHVGRRRVASELDGPGGDTE